MDHSDNATNRVPDLYLMRSERIEEVSIESVCRHLRYLVLDRDVRLRVPTAPMSRLQRLAASLLNQLYHFAKLLVP